VSDLDFLFGPTPHDEAIDFIKSKPAVSRDVFNGLLPELKARAFTITGVEGANVLQRVRDRIADLPAGHDWDDIKKDIVGDISPFIVDPDASPEHRDGQINAANRRAELLLRTHGFQAYQAASYDVMDRQRDVMPFWQYLTMEDDRVRPEHAALDQIVLPASSPFWQGHYPPWDYGCRCQVVAISQEDRDDLAEQDKKNAPDCRLVLEGPQLQHLEHGTLVRSFVTHVPVKADFKLPEVDSSDDDLASTTVTEGGRTKDGKGGGGVLEQIGGWQPPKKKTSSPSSEPPEPKTRKTVSVARTYDLRTPREKQGNDAYGWHPGDMRLSISQLRGRYDAATFADFEAWARRMPLQQGAAKTVWAWLGGAPAGVAPARIAAESAAGVPALIGLLQRMHAQHDAVDVEMKALTDQYTQEIRALPVPRFGSPEEQQVIRKNNEINVHFVAKRNELVAKRELVIAQERQFVRAPAGAQSKLPAVNNSATGIIQHLQEGLGLWRAYAAAAIDIASPMAVFALSKKARAFCSSAGIHLAPGDTASTVMHEIAHWIDRAHPSIAKENIKFLDRRTVGEKAQKLSKLTGNRGYKADEIAKPDKFHSPYVGKIYPGNASEILSMGIERLHKNPGLFAKEDPDYCEHVLKMLRGETNP
jgi:SPP1 gp7 family putative phage head morphogenesis protein